MNQQRLNQPHIQSKIRKSGGMGTIKEATTRTRVNDMLEAKG